MATLGVIKEIRVVEGQLKAVIETGSGPAVTATIMQAGTVDYHPLPGDRVLYHYAGQEVVVSAIFSEDNLAALGEVLIFGRDATGVVQVTFHLKADGWAVVGTGADAVAMSTPLDTYLSNLLNTVAPGGVAIVTPAVGQPCPVASAILAAMIAAFPPAGVAACGSTNLKAD